jgi:hypothetical protein
MAFLGSRQICHSISQAVKVVAFMTENRPSRQFGVRNIGFSLLQSSCINTASGDGRQIETLRYQRRTGGTMPAPINHRAAASCVRDQLRRVLITALCRRQFGYCAGCGHSSRNRSPPNPNWGIWTKPDHGIWHRARNAPLGCWPPRTGKVRACSCKLAGTTASSQRRVERGRLQSFRPKRQGRLYPALLPARSTRRWFQPERSSRKLLMAPLSGGRQGRL